MHERGPALVRIALLSLVFGAFAMALVQPIQAGSPDSPEVQDPADDVDATEPLVPEDVPILGPEDFGPVDIISGWVNGDNTRVWVVITMSADISEDATYNVTFDVGNASYGIEVTGDAVAGPTGVTATATGPSINFTMPVASIGAAAGVVMSNLTINTELTAGGVGMVPINEQTGTDTAGPGAPFTFLGPQPGDLDSDGIPDDCELQYFNSTTAQNNASADMDNDTLTLGQECALGTDPTKADTDGDGTNDKADPAPTDPTQGGTSGSGSPSGSRSSSGSRSGSASGSGSRSNTAANDDQDDKVENVGDAVEKLKSDLGYLGTSAGGMVAVLILAILALAVRWSL